MPLYAFGVSFESNDFHRTSAADDLKSLILGVDGVYKFKGLFLTGEFFWRQRETETSTLFHAPGWYLQGGQMLNRARTWEVAGRYGDRDVNNDIDKNDVTEMRLGLSYYYRRHNLKLQMDLGQLETGVGPSASITKSREFRLQSQFIF